MSKASTTAHAKKATHAKRGTKPKAATTTAGTPRAASKQAKLIEMLKRPEGTTIDEIVKALTWQSHTVRGAMFGALKKKLGLKIESEKVDSRGRTYRIVG